MRLIDADALTDELIKGMEADTDKSIQATFAKSVCMILCKALEKQPTIDAVPVIRCKDCKHAEYEDDGDIMCTFWDFCECNHHVLGNGYCDRAERREHETD